LISVLLRTKENIVRFQAQLELLDSNISFLSDIQSLLEKVEISDESLETKKDKFSLILSQSVRDAKCDDQFYFFHF